MSIGCPVGHPSGPGQHCPLCGRAYVRIELPVLVPSPRHEAPPVPAPLQVRDDGPRWEIEAFQLLTSLASGTD